MVNWYIGCSGFHYKHWKERFYPAGLPERKWFEFYCENFKTLELNVTFYRFPQLSSLQGWYNKSPADFRFAVKAPRGITHYKKFNDVTELVTRFYETINDGLQEKLGPVLFQLPPQFIYDEQKLERIINNLSPLFKNVVELRHASWWRQDVYDALASHNITFCGMSHPALPDDIIQNTSVIYYRFHGVPDLYRSPYSTQSLQKVTDIINANPNTKEAWCYFNNDIDASAILNTKEMMKISIK